MNLASIVISIFLLVLFGLAIRRLIRKGTCGGCSESSSCKFNRSGNVNNGCSGCTHCQAEPVKINRGSKR